MASQFRFEAIGTSWTIDVFDVLSAEQEKNLIAAIHARIAEFDKNYSRFRDDSLVAEMARIAGTYDLPGDAQPMMDLYRDLYKLTNGLITPLIGQVLVDAGYDAQYSLIEKEMRAAPKWEDVLEYAYPKLILKQPVLLDFGSIGKGYLIDMVGGIIRDRGYHSFVINAGGDILVEGLSEPLRIGLENPNDFSQVIGVVELTNGSLCGSSGSRRKWGRFHHIIDPYKLESPKSILATWVKGKTAILTDALATALFFVPLETVTAAYPNIEAGILRDDFSFDRTANFSKEIFVR